MFDWVGASKWFSIFILIPTLVIYGRHVTLHAARAIMFMGSCCRFKHYDKESEYVYISMNRYRLYYFSLASFAEILLELICYLRCFAMLHAALILLTCNAVSLQFDSIFTKIKSSFSLLASIASMQMKRLMQTSEYHIVIGLHGDVSHSFCKCYNANALILKVLAIKSIRKVFNMAKTHQPNSYFQVSFTRWNTLLV